MAHLNVFNGKCIHGIEGAKLVNGVQVSPECAWCKERLTPKEAKDDGSST